MTKKIEKIDNTTQLKDIIISIDYFFKIGDNMQMNNAINLYKSSLLGVNNITDLLFLITGINSVISDEKIKILLINYIKNLYEKKFSLAFVFEKNEIILDVIGKIENILGLAKK